MTDPLSPDPKSPFPLRQVDGEISFHGPILHPAFNGKPGGSVANHFLGTGAAWGRKRGKIIDGLQKIGLSLSILGQE
jgi:hypothetical protein